MRRSMLILVLGCAWPGATGPLCAQESELGPGRTLEAAAQAPLLPTAPLASAPPSLLAPSLAPPTSALVPPAGPVSPAAFQAPVPEAYYHPAPAVALPNFSETRRFESTWYARADYFFWGERVDGQKFMSNNGAMPTLGYQQRYGQQRFRAELFGSRVGYSAEIAFDYPGGPRNVPISNVTDYLGLTGEYEVMYEPDAWPSVSLFAGLGTRFFVRSFPNLVLDDPFHYYSYLMVSGYQEAWWTFYPYLGIERRRTLDPAWEFYWRTRIGVTAFTREHITMNDVTLFPRANLTGQIELGFRGPSVYVSAFFEGMSWSHSPMVYGIDGMSISLINQPNSQLYLVGLKSGFSY